jgi:magnesium transporter
MPVAAACLYRNGQRVREIATDQRVDCAQDKSEFVWIAIADPTEDELRTSQEAYGLHCGSSGSSCR